MSSPVTDATSGMPLRLQRVTLRDWRESDAEIIAPLANNRDVWINLRDRFPYPYTLTDAKHFIARAQAENPRYNFAVCLDDDRPMGSIGIMPGIDIHRISAEIGYWLGEPYWGNGYASEAIKGFSEWVFEHYELVRLYANVFTYNPASARALEKAGFVLEATRRSAAIKEGKICDEWAYARVADGS